MPDRREVQRILADIGLRPQQAAGQNFLCDESVAERMVAAAGVEAGERVLEIGPGLGILTESLLNRGAEVVAVELDRRLAAFVRRRFAAHPGFRLIENDIFKVRLPDVVSDHEYKLVSNLPYGATSLVFRNFLTLSPRPSSLTVMIQKEVAERIVARPGRMSLLSLLVQYYSQPHLLLTVSPSRFYPPPKVESAILQCLDLRSPAAAESQAVFRLARAGFSSRRKQLRNSLAAGLRLSPPELDKKIKEMGLNPTARAQELSLEDWRLLAEKFR